MICFKQEHTPWNADSFEGCSFSWICLFLPFLPYLHWWFTGREIWKEANQLAWPETLCVQEEVMQSTVACQGSVKSSSLMRSSVQSLAFFREVKDWTWLFVADMRFETNANRFLTKIHKTPSTHAMSWMTRQWLEKKNSDPVYLIWLLGLSVLTIYVVHGHTSYNFVASINFNEIWSYNPYPLHTKLLEHQIPAPQSVAGTGLYLAGGCISNMKNLVSVFGKSVVSNGFRQPHHSRSTNFKFSCALNLLLLMLMGWTSPWV